MTPADDTRSDAVGSSARAREAQRQQALLRALWSVPQPVDSRSEASVPTPLATWLQAPDAPLTQRGLQAYRANAQASAERALAGRFLTVQALMGEDAFAAMAKTFWHAQPPTCGDLARLGDGPSGGLPAFIETDAQLADVPYLADIARLDQRVAAAEAAAEETATTHTLALLAEVDPHALQLVMAPGWALCRSRYPIASIWRAHQADAEDAQPCLVRARTALQTGEGECALVWRTGWRAHVQAVDAPQAAWCEALAAGHALGRALREAGDAFNFEAWLLQALQIGWVVGARRV